MAISPINSTPISFSGKKNAETRTSKKRETMYEEVVESKYGKGAKPNKKITKDIILNTIGIVLAAGLTGVLAFKNSSKLKGVTETIHDSLREMQTNGNKKAGFAKVRQVYDDVKTTFIDNDIKAKEAAKNKITMSAIKDEAKTIEKETAKTVEGGLDNLITKVFKNEEKAGKVKDWCGKHGIGKFYDVADRAIIGVTTFFSALMGGSAADIYGDADDEKLGDESRRQAAKNARNAAGKVMEKAEGAMNFMSQVMDLF